MRTAKVFERGQVIIPAEIRRQLGIEPGSELDFSVDGPVIRVEVKGRGKSARPEDGYGRLVGAEPGVRRLAEFDVAEAMGSAQDDRP